MTRSRPKLRRWRDDVILRGMAAKMIYILRHAKAVARDTDIPDFERPLIDRGRSDSAKAATLLNQPTSLLNLPTPSSTQPAPTQAAQTQSRTNAAASLSRKTPDKSAPTPSPTPSALPSAARQLTPASQPLTPPDFILSSDAARTRQTALAINKTLQIPARRQRYDNRLYNAAVAEWIRQLRQLPADCRAPLLVGHNPECEMLTRFLTGADITLSTADFAVVAYDGDWSAIAAGAARLIAHHARKNKAPTTSAPAQNRELSWLSFNERVLQEANDESNPPLTRLMFLGIVSANLDEFFRVRVGALEQLLQSRARAKNADTRDILQSAHERALRLQRRIEQGLTVVLRELKTRHNIQLIEEKQMNAKERDYCREYFERHIRSRLTVLVNLSQKSLRANIESDMIYLAVTMSAADGRADYALIPLPKSGERRFVVMPAAARGARADASRARIAWLDDVIRVALPTIFAHTRYDSFCAHTIKMTRSAEMQVDDRFTADFFQRFSDGLKRREVGRYTRLIYDRDIPPKTLQYLTAQLKLSKRCLLVSAGRYHRLRNLRRFPRIADKPNLSAAEMTPVAHPALHPASSLLDACAKKDQLLYFPYHDYGLIIKLLREASVSPDVVGIHLLVYRFAERSQVFDALLNAVKNGKRVSCVVEIRARFDEAANIRWAKRLEEAGALVSYGLAGYKAHAKLCLIERRSGRRRDSSIAIVSTGNPNEDSARVYTDISLLTADAAMVEDVKKVFRLINDPTRQYKFAHLLVSPRDMREQLLALTRREVKNHQAGKPAGIRLKLNNLIDRQMTRAIESAAAAGVRVDLIIRGTLGVNPDKAELGGRIRAISVIDSLLEHSRMMIFENGGARQVYIGSADWMERNLDHRIEAYAPVTDAALRAELIALFDLQMSDTVKARRFDAAQSNPYVESCKRVRSQTAVYDYYRRRARQTP